MSKEVSCLFDMQHNTSEFNIKFHMCQATAWALITTFGVEENKKNIMEAMNYGDGDFRTILIAHAIEPVIKQYLDHGYGVDEDYYTAGEDEKKERE